MKYVVIQRDEFKRLGSTGDWQDPYLTLAKNYEAEIVRSFGKLVEKGYIYKDLKPVNWCATCETALAEAEVEYEDKTSPSIFVKFKLSKGSGLKEQSEEDTGKDIFFIIWTTTPWTLVANVAIAVHPECEYVYLDAQSLNGNARETYVVAKALAESSVQKMGLKEYKVLKTIKGKELEGFEVRHPFIDRNSKVVTAEYVSMEDGTGCVHTAPGHGQEDYITGKRYKLPTIMPVDAKGRFDKTAGDLSGMKVYDANKPILDKLRSVGSLVWSGDIQHSYPHCWRCKKPIIFRATEQYFLRIDHDGLRSKMLSSISSLIRWIPSSGQSRISAMVENRPDWCLSRQRYWGVPIVAFYCKSCREVLLDHKAIAHVADLFERDGADAWFIKKESELLPAGTKCAKCGNSDFEKETDILDVWFDSGVSHQAVLKKDNHLDYPCELYLEGSDQHRGWFQSALITGMAMDSVPPYKSVLTHGFVVDGEGKKMSKSLGNVITPEQVMKKYGADILRLWVASSDYTEDIRLSEEILTRLADAYRKIRNTYKYLLSNLYDFDPAKDSVDYKDMLEIDRWVLSKLSCLVKSSAEHYDSYSFHKVFRDVYNFCIYEISSVYLDILKDRMYTFRANSKERRSGQTAMSEILSSLVRVTAPLLSMTSDEAWGYFNAGSGMDKPESVHLASWPEDNYDSRFDRSLEDRWSVIISVREAVLKRLEEKRQSGMIGSGLEASVVLHASDDSYGKVLRDHANDLRYIFITSQATLSEKPIPGVASEESLPIAIYIEKAKGEKCQRCWNYSITVGLDNAHPTLCDRCASAVS